jgi:hypothetical protein
VYRDTVARNNPQFSARVAEYSVRLTRLTCPATYQPVLRHTDANGLPNLQTYRPQFQHDLAVHVHRALYPLRLRVVESNNINRSNVTRCDVPIGTCPP